MKKVRITVKKIARYDDLIARYEEINLFTPSICSLGAFPAP